MEYYMLKIIGTICISIISCLIIITRKDDIDISAICIAVLFEIIGLVLINFGTDILNFILLKIG